MKTPNESAYWNIDQETGEVLDIKAGAVDDEFIESIPSKTISPIP